MTNFHVGQKVVCVNADHSQVLVEGRVYTVESVFGQVLPTALGKKDTGVSLHEVFPTRSGLGFAASRFRPVVERKTDISIFQAMLEPKKARADA